MKDNARTFTSPSSNYFFPLDGFAATEPQTFAVIARPTSLAAAMAAMGISGDATNTLGRFLRVNAAGDVGYYDSSSGGVSGGTITTNTWYLLMASKNQSATPNVTTARIYNFSTQTWSHNTLGSVAAGAANTAGRFIIGGPRVNASATFAWIGQIAVAAVFGRDLSQSDAQALVSGAQATKTLWDAQLQAGDHAWDLTSGNVADLITDWVGGADESATGGGRNTGITLYTAAGTVPWDTTVVTSFVDFPTLTVSAGSEVAGAGVLSDEVVLNPTTVPAFSAVQGNNAQPQSITVTGTPGATVTVTESLSWLSVSPTSFVIPDTGTTQVQLNPSLSALSAGTASGVVTFTPANGAAKTLNVSYVVAPPPTSTAITVAPTTVPVFTAVQGTNPLPTTITVSGVPGTQFTIAESISWLSVSGSLTKQIRSDGTMPVELSANLSALGVGQDSGTFTITPSGGSATTVSVSYVITPVTVPQPTPTDPEEVYLLGPRDRLYARLEPLWGDSLVTGQPSTPHVQTLFLDLEPTPLPASEVFVSDIMTLPVIPDAGAFLKFSVIVVADTTTTALLETSVDAVSWTARALNSAGIGTHFLTGSTRFARVTLTNTSGTGQTTLNATFTAQEA